LIKRIIVLLAVTAISVLALAVPPFAQGQHEQGPEHAKSICSFSGLNDPEEVGSPDPALGGRTQSYGQLVRKDVIEPSVVKSGQGTPLNNGTPGGSPGYWCNPNNLPLK
jgi:hypothetical protein